LFAYFHHSRFHSAISSDVVVCGLGAETTQITAMVRINGWLWWN